MNVVTPDWVRDAIFYQIFPDRFARDADDNSAGAAGRGVQFQAWGCLLYTSETPVRPGISLRLPTRYQTMKVMTGAWCISFRMTVSPLSSRVLVTTDAIWLLPR